MIKIIDYKAGNAPSVLNAVSHLGFQAALASSPPDLQDATRIILPGVGSAKATMQSLREMEMIPALRHMVLRNRTPFLGICVGMQILFGHSEEEDTVCLGWLPGRVVKFDASQVRVPQMGWNRVRFADGREDYFYFVNSYYAKPENQADIWGTANYNNDFTAAVRRGNLYGTQFHMEKSGEAGLRLLGEFLKEGGIC